MKEKEKTNWLLTILLSAIAVFVILGPLYITVVIALKSPSDMEHVLALPTSLHLENFSRAWVLTDYPRKFLNTFFITSINLVFTILTNSMALMPLYGIRIKADFSISCIIILSAPCLSLLM